MLMQKYDSLTIITLIISILILHWDEMAEKHEASDDDANDKIAYKKETKMFVLMIESLLNVMDCHLCC